MSTVLRVSDKSGTICCSLSLKRTFDFLSPCGISILISFPMLFIFDKIEIRDGMLKLPHSVDIGNFSFPLAKFSNWTPSPFSVFMIGSTAIVSSRVSLEVPGSFFTALTTGAKFSLPCSLKDVWGSLPAFLLLLLSSMDEDFVFLVDELLCWTACGSFFSVSLRDEKSKFRCHHCP